jgi:hypothetical protein
MDTFNTVEYAKEVREAFSSAVDSKKEIFEKAVAYFGLDALRQTKDGGLSLRAMQASAKPETKKKAANEVGLTVAQAEELAAMIAEINKDRVNVWQDFQRAYFKPEKPEPKPKTAEEIEIAAQKATRSELLKTSKALSEQVALIKAEKTVLESQGKELPAERAAELEKIETLKKGVKGKTDSLKERIDFMTQQKDLPAQIKKVTDFRKAMAKFLKVHESTVGQMSLNGILKALNSVAYGDDDNHIEYGNVYTVDHEGNKVD